MKTVEILYQAFKVRYSLNQLQALLDRGCRVALLGPDEATDILRRFFGDPVPNLNGEDPSADLVSLSWELTESDQKELSTCDACLVLYPDGPPETDELREVAGKVPIHVKTLWMCLSDSPKSGTFHEKDLTLPTVQALPKAKAQERFIKLLIVGLPQIVVILARNWTNLRTQFCKTLTRRTALRNGVRSGVSSLPLRSVPIVGQWLAMLATSAEMMILTASQLRLSFIIAAAHNRPLDFFDRISELWPIVGSAYGLRGMSRQLVKRMPKFAPGLKASIAFSGTYAIGEACRLYYEYGQPTSDEVRRELLRRSHEEGAREAQRLFRRVLAGQPLEDLDIDEEEGAELEEVVDSLTRMKEADPPPRELDDEPEIDESMEPTVEMDAVPAAPEKPDVASPEPVTKEEVAEPKAAAAPTKVEEASKKPEPEAKQPSDEAGAEKPAKKKRKRGSRSKPKSDSAKSGEESKSKSSSKKSSSKQKKSRQSKKKS